MANEPKNRPPSSGAKHEGQATNLPKVARPSTGKKGK